MGPAFLGLIRTPPEKKRDMATIEAAVRQTEDAFDLLEAHLSRHAYVGGAAFGFGDVVLCPSAHRWLHMPVERRSRPALEAWYRGVAGRPAAAVPALRSRSSEPTLADGADVLRRVEGSVDRRAAAQCAADPRPRRPRAHLHALETRGRALTAGALVLLVALGALPVGTVMLRALEDAVPPWQDDGRPVAGVIVLGGAVDGDISLAAGRIALNENGERIVAMVEFARTRPDLPVVFTGGSGALLGHDTSEGAALREFEAALGLPKGPDPVRDGLRNTLENAASATPC